VVIYNFHIGEGDILGLWQGFVQTTLVFFLIHVFLCIRMKRIVAFDTDEHKTF